MFRSRTHLMFPRNAVRGCPCGRCKMVPSASDSLALVIISNPPSNCSAANGAGAGCLRRNCYSLAHGQAGKACRCCPTTVSDKFKGAVACIHVSIKFMKSRGTASVCRTSQRKRGKLQMARWLSALQKTRGRLPSRVCKLEQQEQKSFGKRPYQHALQ